MATALAHILGLLLAASVDCTNGRRWTAVGWAHALVACLPLYAFAVAAAGCEYHVTDLIFLIALSFPSFLLVLPACFGKDPMMVGK